MENFKDALEKHFGPRAHLMVLSGEEEAPGTLDHIGVSKPISSSWK